MGLYVCHRKCRLERILIVDNNFITSNYFNCRYGKYGKEKSPCYKVRDFLHNQSVECGFKWEFIHIPQRFVKDKSKIEEVSQILYEHIETGS